MPAEEKEKKKKKKFATVALKAYLGSIESNQSHNGKER